MVIAVQVMHVLRQRSSSDMEKSSVECDCKQASFGMIPQLRSENILIRPWEKKIWPSTSSSCLIPRSNIIAFKSY